MRNQFVRKVNYLWKFLQKILSAASRLPMNICPDSPVASAGSATAVWKSEFELSGR